MRLLPIVKGTLQKFKSRKSEEPTTPNEQADGFHTTPAGEFPRNGPKSSIVACIMFYLSKIITIIGLILVARAVWFEEVIILHSILFPSSEELLQWYILIQICKCQEYRFWDSLFLFI